MRARAVPIYGLAASPAMLMQHARSTPVGNIESAIRALFAANEQGAWYDPSDFSTMFQDSAGTVPAALNQPVGLRLDKRLGLVLSANKAISEPTVAQLGLSGGALATDSTPGDALHTTWVRFVNNTASAYAYQVLSVPSRVASVSIDVEMLDSDTPPIFTDGGAGSNGAVVLFGAAIGAVANLSITKIAPFRYRVRVPTYCFPSAGSNFGIVVYNTNTFRPMRISGWDVKELLGNHAYQPTAASRAILKAEPASFATELVTNGSFEGMTTGWTTFGNATVATNNGQLVVTAGSTSTSVQGTYVAVPCIPNRTYAVSVDLNAASSINRWLRVSSDQTASTKQAELAQANFVVGKNTVTFTATQATHYVHVNPYNTGDTLTVDNISCREVLAWKNYYLEYDGVDDFYVTNSIDFSGTDKMTVIAGVRKNSDAAIGMICELSNSADSNNSSFYLASAVPSNTANYLFFSKGTTGRAVSVEGVAAPNTAVIAATADIALPSAVIRRNGIQAGTTSSSQGTGTYGNYPIFIGRRNGSLLPFNGREYGLIIRGAASDASQLSVGEIFMNSRTGAY